MKGFDVLKIKSAVKARNKFDLSRTHLTTANFGEIIPLLSEETIPGDKIEVDANYFSRLAPLVRPTYGKFSFKTVAGYVPYHMVAADAEAWFAGKTTWEGSTPVGRYFTVSSLHSFLTTSSLVTTSTGANSGNCDYSYINESGTRIYKVFTKPGKYYAKVLNALGYALPSGVDLQANSGWQTNVAPTKLSAYPLLAFFKLYNDYMSQSQRFNTSQLSNWLNGFKYKRAISGIWNNSTGELNVAALTGMFGQLALNYENDYFTSAWQSPNSPLASVENVSTVSDSYNSTTTTFIDTVTDTAQNVYLTEPNNNKKLVSQRMLDFLKDFDNWVRRNNYSGSRAVQQVYSRFGIKTSDFRDHYAHVLGTDVMPIQVGDVTATADAGSTVLGDYAGKGIMSGNKSISMQADDYGILLILGYFTITPMNPYGFDRKVLRSTPLDYYNPEFDGLGADPISVGEYFADPVSPSANSVYDTSVFGYTERYNSYRYGRDQITGEFRNYHKDADMNCWHTGRLLTAVRDAGNLVAQNVSVNTLPQTDSEYNRIFSITNSQTDTGAIDHFYLTAQFKVNALRPMLNLNQVVNLGEGDTNVPRNGNVIS